MTIPADPYGEWLYHQFMDQIIKDNTFSVADWIGILRNAGVPLAHASSSTFDVKPGKFVAEPECFIIGQKNVKPALLGPYPHPRGTLPLGPATNYGWSAFGQQVSVRGITQIFKLLSGKDVLHIVESSKPYQDKIRNRQNRDDSSPEMQQQQLCSTNNYQGEGLHTKGDHPYENQSNEQSTDIKSSHGNAVEHSGWKTVDIRELERDTVESRLDLGDSNSVVAMHMVHLPEDLENYFRKIVRMAKCTPSKIVLLEPAPCNETLDILNDISRTIGLQPFHHGACLAKAVEVFTKAGYECNHTLVDDDICCPEDDIAERSKNASELLAATWYAGHPEISLIKKLLNTRLREHFESQYEMNGHPNALGFANLILVAVQNSQFE